MERYQDVIRLSFFGHVHEEMFSSVRAFESKKSIGVHHWTGSITTFSERQVPAYPSFRNFILDEETMLPIKIETYSMNITREVPEFELDHELTELYHLPDLSPSSFEHLSQQLRKDADLALVFERAKNAFGPNVLDECDRKCRRMLQCTTSYSVHSDVRSC